jgi:glutamine cyclotransferase
VSLKREKEVTVTDPKGGKIWLLNELEYANGFIYSNVWYKDFIHKIDPVTFIIVETIDFSQLYPTAKRRINRADCLNGIAHNKADNTFTLTGKLWPNYYVGQVMA